MPINNRLLKRFVNPKLLENLANSLGPLWDSFHFWGRELCVERELCRYHTNI